MVLCNARPLIVELILLNLKVLGSYGFLVSFPNGSYLYCFFISSPVTVHIRAVPTVEKVLGSHLTVELLQTILGPLDSCCNGQELVVS